MTNVLFIIYDLERGGPEMRLLDFVRSFPKALRAFICVTSEQVSLLKEFQKYSRDIKIVPIKRPYTDLDGLNAIREYVALNGITIVNTFDLKGLIIALFLRARCRGLKIVHHTVDLLHNYRSKHKALLWLLLKNADASICNSESSKDILKGRYIAERKISVIYNGVDTGHFSADEERRTRLRASLGIGQDAMVLGTVANFRKEKNYPFLFDCFREMHAKYPRLKLLCVGGGPLLDKSKEFVKNSDIKDEVIFTGYSENVASYIEAMDFFTLCSLSEGMPNVLIQAMSMGVPVLSTSAGGCKEIIDHSRNGILFDPTDRGQFMSGLSSLIEDRALCASLVRNARAKVEERFTLQAMIDNYSGFYAGLDNPALKSIS